MDYNKELSNNGTSLRFWFTSLSKQDIQDLIIFLQAHSNIEKLKLTGNNIGDKGITALALHLPKNLTSLGLSSNNIGDKGITALALHLPKNLTSLGLSSNNIGSKGIQNLIKRLPKNLTSLNLSNNNIDNGDLEALDKKWSQNPTNLRVMCDHITDPQTVEKLAEYKNLRFSFRNCITAKFYNLLLESPNKTDDQYKNSIIDTVFWIAQFGAGPVGDITCKHILTHSQKYPFLINSKDKDGHKLSHFYTHPPEMQKFLFEHGLIPELEKKDGRLQRIIEDNQSVHNSSAVKKTNFIVKELVESIAANKDELKQEADSYLADTPKLLQQYKDNPIKTKLLNITKNEKRSVMEKTLREGNPVPSDQEFVEIVMSKAKEALKTQYLRKKATGEYDYGYPTHQFQYDYSNDNAKVTIPQSIGYIKLLIDGFDIPLNERKELLVTLAEQNPELVEQKLPYIKSEFENNSVAQEQVTKRSEFYKLLNDITDSNKIDRLFREISGLNLEKIWREQKEFTLAKQIYVAATTYGESNSACIQGTWTQIINSVDEIHLGLLDKFQKHLEEKKGKEAQKEVITAENITEFEEHLAAKLIQHIKENSELKESLLDFALAMVDVEKSEEITLEQQQILAKINQEFSSEIKKSLPNYDSDIPTLQEYKIIIDAIADVSGQKIQQSISGEKEQTKLAIDNSTSQVSPTRKAIYATMIAPPFIAIGIYTAVALSAGIVSFNPIIAAGIFIGVAVAAIACFAIIKISEKVSEEKGKDKNISTALKNALTLECFRSSKIAIPDPVHVN